MRENRRPSPALHPGTYRPRMITSRNRLYCGVVVVGFANGASDRIASSISDYGLAAAVFDMFGVSLVVWIALVATVWLLLQSEERPAGATDFVVSGVASTAFLLPVPQLSWVALTGVALHLARTPCSAATRRAASVLGALTIPMLWSRLVFALFSGPILVIDAKLVSWIVGTQSDANTIPFADGSGVLFLEPACSSMTNVSLALVCGVLIVKLYDLRWSAAVLRAVVAACLATVVINVVRISSIGILPAYYDLIHGPVGMTVAEWTTNLAVVTIYAGGLRPDVPARA